MNNVSDVNYLIKIKQILIDEIKVLESIVSNETYLLSLPIQYPEVRNIITEYNSTNNFVDFNEMLEKKRLTLANVNRNLKNLCNHRIITGDLHISKHDKNSVKYCILCMNIFD